MKSYKCSDGTYVRSQYERTVYENILKSGYTAEYEPGPVTYKVIETRKYTPDIVLKSGVWVELKGYLRPEDKRKLRRIRLAYPTRNFCILFQREQPHAKGAKSTNIQWAENIGMIAAAGDSIPKAWHNLALHRT